MTLIEQLKVLADRAYCDYIAAGRETLCRGYKIKMLKHQFGKPELDAHTKAAELIGRHHAYTDAINFIMKDSTMNYQYGQIIEVRGSETSEWLRKIYLFTDGNNVAVCAPSAEQKFLQKGGSVPYVIMKQHRPIKLETFEAGQLVLFELNGYNELGLYVEMSGIDRHTIENGVGRILVTKVWAPSIDTARQMFPQFKIEEKA